MARYIRGAVEARPWLARCARKLATSSNSVKQIGGASRKATQPSKRAKATKKNVKRQPRETATHIEGGGVLLHSPALQRSPLEGRYDLDMAGSGPSDSDGSMVYGK